MLPMTNQLLTSSQQQDTLPATPSNTSINLAVNKNNTKYFDTCSICIENIELNKKDISITSCNHNFHASCIEKWSETCPICRRNITNIFFGEGVLFIQDIKNGNFEVLMEKIKTFFKIEDYNYAQKSVSDIAIEDNNLELIKLLACKNKLHIKKFTKNNLAKVVDLLITIGIDPNLICDDEGTKLICYATDICDINLINKLIDSGANANEFRITRRKFSILQQAAVRGNFEVVELLIARGANINHCNIDGESALDFAVRNKHLQVAKILIDNGADIEKCTIEKKSEILQFALEYGYIKLVNQLLDMGIPIKLTKINEKAIQILIDAGINVNILSDNEGNRLICYAIEFFDINLINQLFDLGANANELKIAENKLSILHWATMQNKSELVKLLLSRGAEINYCTTSGESALNFAIKNNCLKIAKILIENGADIEKCNFKEKNNVLRYALIYNHTKLASRLIAIGVPIDLTWMSIFDNTYHAIINTLINIKVDINMPCDKAGNKLICYAVEFCGDTLVRKLIDLGAEVNEVEKSARQASILLLATRRSNKKLVQLLLARGADINYRSAYGKSALDYAMLNNNLEIVELLATEANIKQCEIKAKNKIFYLALKHRNSALAKLLINTGIAIDLDHIQEIDYQSAIKTLINIGVDVNISYGNKLIYYAIKFCNTELVRKLVDLGANVDEFITAESQLSILHWAAMNGNADKVELLISRGVKINHCDINGKSALDFAIENGYVKVATTLIENGADINKYTQEVKNKFLELAIANNHLLAAKTLIENRANIKKCGERNKYKLLYFAIENDYLMLVKTLTGNGIDIYKCDAEHKIKFLHSAIKHNDSTLIKNIINKKIVNIKNCSTEEKCELLQLAMEYNNSKLTKQLTKAGATINVTAQH